MDPDPHIKFMEINKFSYCPYNFDHAQAHFYDIAGFFYWVSLKCVSKTHHNVAVPYCVNLINFEF